ncbi:hypothetical protein BU16DRAFT_543506 [Lophium mytilinum]|uniref:Uncharacterized protein n=1 Tax=Lophium mytilinum TaxID=390894 RepID=A0A6A6QF94_9PEZI|nr:hypothetical protein BU16DRAFT_543506 [Lophium mytilinum]
MARVKKHRMSAKKRDAKRRHYATNKARKKAHPPPTDPTAGPNPNGFTQPTTSTLANAFLPGLQMPANDYLSGLQVPTNDPFSGIQMPTNDFSSRLQMPTNDFLSGLQMPTNDFLSGLHMPANDFLSGMQPADNAFLDGLQAPASAVTVQSALDALYDAQNAIMAAQFALIHPQSGVPNPPYPMAPPPTIPSEPEFPAEPEVSRADSGMHAAFTPLAAPSVVSEWLSDLPGDTSVTVQENQAQCGKCQLEGRKWETHAEQACPYQTKETVKKKRKVKNEQQRKKQLERWEKHKEKRREEQKMKRAGKLILEDMEDLGIHFPPDFQLFDEEEMKKILEEEFGPSGVPMD